MEDVKRRGIYNTQGHVCTVEVNVHENRVLTNCGCV